MKKYLLNYEFFGLRVYDTIGKKEFFFTEEEGKKVRELIAEQYEVVNSNITAERKLSAPLKISMNITKKCNLKCKQCFSDSGVDVENELTTQEIYRLFDDMKKYGTYFICIGGGEPFMKKDIFEILKYGSDLGLSLSIVTNGTLLTDKVVEELNRINLDTIWISFEGLKENHEALRGKGTFEKSLRALELLKKSTCKTAIRVSISKKNIPELNDIVKIAEEYDVDLIRFTPLLDFGRAANQNFTVNQDEYLLALKNLSQIETKIKVITPINIENAKFWVTPSDFGCHCGKEAIWIDECGNYSPCFFYGDDYVIGNIKTKSYKELWDISNEISTFEGNDICKKCSNYINCRGGCRARVFMEYKNFNDVDPLCPLKKNLLK